MNQLAFLARLLAVSLLACSLPSRAADPPAAPAKTDETNSQELRTYLQLQEQLHATQLAIERGRTEADAAAAHNADTLAARLEAIDKSLATQRARELEAMQYANRVMLIVAGSFAAVGFAAMLLMAYFQWRTVNSLAEITASLPAAHALALAPLPAPEPGDTRLLTAGPAPQANVKLLGALEQLEKRIAELEHPSHPPLSETAPDGNGAGAPAAASNDTPAVEPEVQPAVETSRANTLLGKGQSLLKQDSPEAALACFDEILAAAPNHAEALVKKGMALERLRRLDEAIQCYDRAIAADSAMTIAYLYKGGLYNRMARFSEAVACYEQALRTQEKRAA